MGLMHRHRLFGHGHTIRRGLTSIPRVRKHGVNGRRSKKERPPHRILQVHRRLAGGFRTTIRQPPNPGLRFTSAQYFEFDTPYDSRRATCFKYECVKWLDAIAQHNRLTPTCLRCGNVD
jgi:hypothetical protein